MDRRFLTVLGVSLLFALVISTVFYQMTARAGPGKRTDPAGDMRDIVVASRPLGIGASVRTADIKIVKMPVSVFPKGAFSKPEEVLDRPVMREILLDEPLLEGRLAIRGSGVGLAPIIPVGMRAVSVRVNDVAGVAGFVLPGMRVDVLVTGRPPEMNGTVTTTCLQNILVLSAGTTIQADGKGQAIQAPTVTLLVSPDQAETLTLANNEGHIQLVLRNGSDQTIEKTSGREVSELYGMRAQRPKPSGEPRPARPRAQPAPRPTPAPPPPPPPPDQVIVIRGTTKSVEIIGGHSPEPGR
jgi:pilus assembly protein CpaB